jgi:hypothetical protein
MIFAMIIEGEDHGFDLLVWVELRVPSLRTLRTGVSRHRGQLLAVTGAAAGLAGARP